MKKELHIASKAVHCGREDRKIPTIDLTTTTRIDSLPTAIESIEAMNEGSLPLGNSIYSRLHNDTVAGFEQAFAELENAEAAVAFASGMSAVSTLILQASHQGGHIIAMKPIYGATDHVLSNTICHTQVSWCTPDNFTDYIQQNTALIMIETPANPTCSLIDIQKVVDGAQGIPVSVDSTFASPILQQPLQWGASYAVHSATKFIGGHSDILGGVIACSERDAKRLRKLRIYTGGCLHPLSGYLLHRGLQTLVIRIEKAQTNASILADRFAKFIYDHPTSRKQSW